MCYSSKPTGYVSIHKRDLRLLIAEWDKRRVQRSATLYRARQKTYDEYNSLSWWGKLWFERSPGYLSWSEWLDRALDLGHDRASTIEELQSGCSCTSDEHVLVDTYVVHWLEKEFV